MRATFTTTVAYSSNSGDMTATDMINTLKNWADINGADALIQIGELLQLFIKSVLLLVMVLVQELPLPEHFFEVL